MMWSGQAPLAKLGLKLVAIRDRAQWWRISAIISAAALSTVAVLGLLAGMRAHDGQQERDQARTPRTASTVQSAELYWIPTADVFDGRQFTVVYLARPQGSLLLPPGVAGPLAPGEVAVSPALQEALGADPGLADRYRNVAQRISAPGLRDAGELLAYVGAETDEAMAASSRTVLVEGFGGASAEAEDYFLGTTVATPVFAASAFAFVLAPVFLLLVIATRSSAGARDARVTALVNLGLSARLARLVNVYEVAPIATAGSLVGVLCWLVVSRTVTRLPYVDFRLQASDFAISMPIAAAAIVTPIAFCAVVAYVLPTVGRSSAHVGPVVYRPIALAPMVAGLVGLLASVIVRGEGGAQVFLVSVGLLVLGLPLALGRLVRSVAVRLANTSAVSTAALVALRRLAHDPGTTTRWLAAIVTLLFLLVNAQAWESRLSGRTEPASDATSEVRVTAVGASATLVRSLEDPRWQTHAYVYNSNGAVVALARCAATATDCRAVDGSTGLQEAIAAVPMPDPTDAASAHAPYQARFDISSLPPEETDRVRVDGFVLSGGHLPETDIRRVASENMVAPFVLTPSDLLLKPSPLVAWLHAGVGLASLLCVLGVAVAMVDAAVRRRDDYRKLLTLGARRAVVRRAVLWEAAAPSIVGIALATATSVPSAWAIITISHSGSLSLAFVVGVVGALALVVTVAVTLSAVVGLPGDVLARSHLRSHGPVRDRPTRPTGTTPAP